MDQNIILQQADYNVKSNMAFFRAHVPALYEMLHNFKSENIEIYINEETQDFNYVYNKYLLYEKGPQQTCKEQVESFLKEPTELIRKTPLYKSNNTISYKYVETMQNFIKQDECYTYINNFQNIPLLIIIGVGCGYHIEYLLQQFSKNGAIKHVLIIEPDLELFYLSLSNINWEKIFRYFASDNKSLTLQLNNNINELIQNVVSINPVFINHALIYTHFLERDNLIKQELLNQLFIVDILFGFYDDEKMSLDHTIGNIKNKIPVYTRNQTLKNEANAFIIGAGPSLDNDIETIKKYKDNAVIFSCGSAIRTLEKNNIMPDFHIEIERTYDTYKALMAVDKDYLKQIPFIGMNTIHPDVFNLFKENFMFLKATDSGSYLFPAGIPQIYYSNPTVTNGALSLSLYMGFKNLYLFGVDMGYKDPKYNHSKHNIAMDKNSPFFKPTGSDKLIETEGNFGGKFYSEAFLAYAKTSIEELLTTSFADGVNVYNCSDGLKIANTISLKPENIMIKNEMFNKENAIRFIKKQFSKGYLSRINIKYDLNKNLSKIDQILDSINNNLKNKSEIIDAFYKMYQEFKKFELISGEIYRLQNIIYSLLVLEQDEEKAVHFINDAFSLVREMLIEIKKDLNTLFEGL